MSDFGLPEQEALHALWPVAVPAAVVAACCTRLSGDLSIGPLLAGATGRTRIPATLEAWLRLLRGPWNDARPPLVESTGAALAELGFAPRDVVTTTGAIRVELARRIDQPAGIIAIHKAIDVDLALLLEPFEAGGGDRDGASLGGLAEGLSDRVRNPLHTLQLNLELAARRLRRAEPDLVGAGEALGSAADEVRAIANMMSEFVEFARPGALHRSRADLRASTATAVSLERADAAQRGVELALEAGDPVELDFDTERMKEAVVELVRNAIDAAPAGGCVCVRIRTDRDRACIDVEDCGHGLSAPDAPVFAPFFTTRPGRAGLGLAIVRRTVLAHGGEIEVQSQPGRTHFAIWLPLTTAASVEGGSACMA